MESIIDANLSFNIQHNVLDCDLDESIVSEGCAANVVQHICRIEDNMNDLRISTRTGVKRIEVKVNACELEISKLLDSEEVNKKKEPIKTACSFKIPRKEEISKLLRCCASVRRKESSMNIVEESKRIHLFQTKKVKSHIIKVADNDFVTMKQIPSIN